MRMKKKKRSSKAKMKKKLADEVLDFFQSHPAKSYNYKQVSSRLNIKSKQKRKLVMDTLADLERKDYLDEVNISQAACGLSLLQLLFHRQEYAYR